MSKTKKNECINYSNYEVNEVVKINRYIGEISSPIANLILKCFWECISGLLVSPTGSGKTKSVIEMLELSNFKSIFVVPNTSIAEQIETDFENVKGVYGKISINKILNENHKVLVMTWDKFIQIKGYDLSNYLVVLDEIHQVYIDIFRKNKINQLMRNINLCRGRLDITATPSKLDFVIYNYILYYKQELKTNYNVKLYTSIENDDIIKIIKDSNKFAVYIDDIKYLNFLKENISLSKKGHVLTSANKEISSIYESLVQDSKILNDGIMTTSVLNAGVNVKDKDITDIIIVDKKDPATIKQFVARFRDLENVNVHIFNSYDNSSLSEVYNIENRIDYTKKVLEPYLNSFNSIHKDMKNLSNLNIKPFELTNASHCIYDEDKNEYVIDDIGIRYSCYNSYYNKADILSHKELLEEYFEDVLIVQTNQTEKTNKAQLIYNKFYKEDRENALIELGKYKDYLVGAVEIIDASNKNIDITEILKSYFSLNCIDYNNVIQVLEKETINKYLYDSDIRKRIIQYTKYVVEYNFEVEIGWNISSFGNRRKGKFFEKINSLIYKEVKDKYKKAPNPNLIENRVYNMITKYFSIDTTYTTDEIEKFAKALRVVFPTLKKTLNKDKIIEKLNSVYNINSKNIQVTKEKRLRYYTIISYKTLDDIAKEYNLTNESKNNLQFLVNKKIKKIVSNYQNINILNVEDILLKI